MPKKQKETTKNKDSKSSKRQPPKSARCIGNKSPGPARYLLPTLTGYPKHDATKYRNPAYTLRQRQNSQVPCTGPGPKYNVWKPPRLPVPAYTMGYKATSSSKRCSPGPYTLPEGRSLKFTIGSRTNPRSGCPTPGPYVLPPVMGCRIPDKTASPCFTFGARPCGTKCDGSPGPNTPTNLDVVKPKAPRFSFGARQTGDIRTCGPGPKYMFCYKCFKCAPKISFGIKHSECSPPYITECDEKC